MTTIAPSFLIRTSPFLQKTRTCLKASMSSNFNQIRPLTTELPALEPLNNQCMILSTLLRLRFDWIFFILAGIKDNYKVSDDFEIQPGPIMTN